MAYADHSIRHLSFREVLHRLAGVIPRLRRADTDAAPPAADDGCSASLDSGTLHDIGACRAYRDYRSAVTLGAGAQPRLGHMVEAARWNAMR